MELKIICQCGQKYKFDVQPVNGRMPFTVNCPICQRDGTAAANDLLAHNLTASPLVMQASASAAPSAPPPPLVQAATLPPLPHQTVAAPMPVGFAPPPPPPVAQAAPPPIAPAIGGLKINKAAHPAPASATTPVAPPGDNTPPAIGAIRPFAVAAAANPQVKTSFGMGLLGGFIGALVGVIIYYLVFQYTGLRLRILAVGVGALAGWLADLMGKGEGSKELGGITAVLVVAGIIATQYFVALGWWHKEVGEVMNDMHSIYDTRMVEAKEVVKVVPTGSDAEIRAYLAKQESDDDNKVTPASISDDEVKEFRSNQLPEDQKLASGQMTREQFEQKNGFTEAEKRVKDIGDDNTFKSFFMLKFWGIGNLFALAAAAAVTFKLSTNARGG